MKVLALGALLAGSMACALEVAALGNTDPGTGIPDGQDRSVRAGDIDVGYRVYGIGDPLVMIMGYGSTMQLWEPATLAALAVRYRVIVFDNRGMGATGAGEKPFSLEQFADDTANFMDAVGVPKARVLGWSMGSLVAQELALRHPGKVERAVLYATHCDASMFPPAPEVLRSVSDPSGTPEERGMRYIGALFPEDWLARNGQRVREVFFRPMGEISGENVGRQAMAIGMWKGTTDRLGSIAAPVLVLAGTEDRLVPAGNSRFVAGKIPGAKLVLVENCGHGLMFQDPGRFRDEVLGFLD